MDVEESNKSEEEQDKGKSASPVKRTTRRKERSTKQNLKKNSQPVKT